MASKLISYYGLDSPLPPDYKPNAEFNKFVDRCVNNLTNITAVNFYEICFDIEQVKALLYRWNVELNKKPELTYIKQDGFYMVRKKKGEGRPKKCRPNEWSCEYGT